MLTWEARPPKLQVSRLLQHSWRLRRAIDCLSILQLPRYLTPRMRISTNQLPSTTLCGPDPSSPIPPSYLHFVCSPLRALEITDEAIALNWPTYFVYEPIPPDCNPSELENLKQVAKRMRVLSFVSCLLSLVTFSPASADFPDLRFRQSQPY